MNIKKSFQFLITACLLFTAVDSIPQQAPVAKAQPQLVQMAADQPSTLVQVIVQKAAGTTGTEERVSALGGKITQDLRIINAFAAEMSARDAVQLSKAGDVRWVSLDGVMKSSVCSQCVDTSKLANAYIGAIRSG